MSTIDKQRIADLRTLVDMGYVFLQRCGLGKPRPVIGKRPSSVGSSPDPGRLGSRAAQRVASP